MDAEKDLTKEDPYGDDQNDDGELEKANKKNNYYEEELILACKKGLIDKAKFALAKRPEGLNFDKNKRFWTPLVWAACKNQIEIVKFLLSKQAGKLYIPNPNDPNNAENPYKNPQKSILGVINEKIRSTPLQLASFKGNLQVVWLLLKEGLSVLDVDQFGNNCILLAASGGSVEVFQSLLIWGVDLNCKNARGHDVVDLATSKEILKLISDYKKATHCAKSQKELTGVTKHWCSTTKKFYHPEHYEIRWVWENKNSEEKERLDGKCHDSWNLIQQFTNELEHCMRQYQHKALSEKLDEISLHAIEIDLKLHNQAIILQEKLRTQNVILDFIDSLKVVENYKTLRKSVSIIKEMKEDAVQRGVIIDESVIEIADNTIERLVAERNLRFELDNLDVGNCNPDEVKNLQDLMDVARKSGVAENYLNDAEVLKLKMARSIQTKDIYKLFTEYPERPVYTVPIELDPKTKKPWDPEEKKHIDIKILLAPKKKPKKKEPKFIIPDWANELPDMEKQIKGIEELLKSSAELELHKEFIVDAEKEIARMKKELKYRKALKREEEIIAEFKAMQKKKK